MELSTYESALNNIVHSDEFNAMNSPAQQQEIKRLYDAYIQSNPDAVVEDVDSITERINVRYLRATGQGRAIPDVNNIIFPNQEEGFNDLSVEDRNKKIEEFRLKIPELAKQNPHQRGDTEYFLQQSANELERRVNGEGNGRIHSMGSSLAEGFLARLADSFGATDTAESIRRTFHENPEYDDEFFTNQLSQGVGSGFASVAIMAGLALTTKGLGGTAAASEAVGTIGSLLTNGVTRYNEGYKNAIDAGLDEDKASDAGFAATPAAVIDALSDRILSSGIMPDHINKVFASGTEVEKKAMFGALIKDASYRGRLFNYAKSALGEGLSEAAGDYVAAYGPYLQNGDDKYLPTAKESINSFMLGAVIGGGMTAGFDLPNLLGNKTGVTTEVNGKKITPTYDTADQRDLAETQKSLEQIQSESGHQEIYQMLAQGRYREAFQLSTEKIKQQDELAKKRAAVDEAVQKLKQKENPETLDENVLDLEGPDDQAPKNNINEGEQKPSGRNALIQIAKSEGVDLAKMTRQEYADYAVKHGQPLTSNEFRQRPEFRGMSKEEAKPLMDANYANTPSRKGAFTKLLNFGKELRQLLNKPENASGVEIEKGIKFLPSFHEWLHFSINKGVKLNPKKETPKSYVGFKDIYKSVTPQKIQGFTVALKEAGYNGQVKFAFDIEFASNITDQLVMHAATREMADLGLETARTYFGDQIDFTDTGSDNDGKSYSELLAERTQKASTARKSTEPLTPIQSASAAAKAERREEVRRMMSGLPPDVQQQLESIQEAEDAMDMEPGVVVGQEAFFNAQRDRFKGRLRRGFERMVSDIQARNPGLKFEVDETLDAAALYNQQENKIIFSSRAPSLRAMAHETAHAFTAQEINKYVTSREGTYKEKLEAALEDKEVPQYIKDLIRVYKNAVKLAKMQHVSGQVITSENLEMAKNMSDLEYGFTSIEEFVAEAFGSSKFQDFISQIPFEGKTVWQHLVDIVSRLMDWMSDIANPEFLMRNDGNNTLRATLGLASQFGASENTNTKNNINFLPSDKVRKLNVSGTAEKFIYQYENKIEWNSVYNKKTQEERIAEFKRQAQSIVEDRTSDESIHAKANVNLRKYLEGLASKNNLVGQAREAAEQFKRDPEGHSKKLSEDLIKRRIEGMNEWKNYLLNINDLYASDPFFVAYVWNGITSNMTKTNTDGTPALDVNALAYVYEESNTTQGLRDFNDSYERAAERASLEAVSKDNSVTLPNGTTWIKIPQSKQGEPDYEKNLATLRNLSLASWCTSGPQMSATYIQRGPFWMLADGGKIRMAIRFDGGEVAEIQGPANNGSIPNEYLEHVVALKDSGKLGSISYRAEQSITKAIERQKEIDELKSMDPFDAMRRIGLGATQDDEGNITLKPGAGQSTEFNIIIKDNPFIDYSRVTKINHELKTSELHLFPNLRAIKTLVANDGGEFSNLETIQNFFTMYGFEEGTQLLFPKVKAISERAFRNHYNFFPNATTIIGDVRFFSDMSDESLQSLKQIEEVLGSLTSYSKESFPNLKMVSGEISLFEGSFPALERAQGDVFIGASVEVPSLKSVEGKLTISALAPKLQYVETLISAYNIDAPLLVEVKQIGTPTDTASIIGKNNIQRVIGDVFFTSPSFDDEANHLEEIGGNLIIESSSYFTKMYVKKVGGSVDVKYVDFPYLKYIGGDLIATGSSFPKLEKIEGQVSAASIHKMGSGIYINYDNNAKKITVNNLVSSKKITKNKGSKSKNNINYLPREDDQVLYHGGAYNGKGNIKTSGRGALGSGAYFTPKIETATEYSKSNGWGEPVKNGQVSKFSVALRNPLKLYANKEYVTDPAVDALVALGLSKEKAEAKIEKAYDDQGYPGKQISSLGLKQGYDGIEYYDREGNLSEVVAWKQENIQYEGPVEKNNINYLPEQRRNHLAKNMFKQLAQITSGNITDTADAGTQRIIEILSKMRVADISRLDPEMKDFLSMLIQNVYNARKSGVKSPEMRLASPLMAEHLQTMLNYMEQDAIDNILNDYDGIVPMNDSVLQMGRDELESYINDYVEKNGLQEAVFEQIGKGNPEAKRKANERLQKIYAKWRERYQEIKKVAKDRFVDSENYINETEAAHGAKYEDAYLRDFVKVHYDYLMGVDVSQLSGRELYEHFFAINNLIDGSFRFAPTVAFIAKQRNNEEQIQELANTFRDAVSSRNKALQWVDDTNRYAELHQVQLQRMSSFDNTRDFLQNKLLGKLHNAIVTESYNRKLAYSQEFIDFRIELEKNEFGREVNTEDRVVTSIAARLMQYALGENPDKALMRNIKKERASIKNIIHNSVNTDNVKLHKARVQFIFEEMVKDLEAYGPGVMQHFMDTLPARMSGTESAAIGEARMKWLGKAQEIFSRFNLESKTISEGFHKKPFKQYVHYMSNEVFSTDSTPRDEPKITDPISAFDQADHKIGIRSEAAHLKERQAALGDTDHYSYNLEGTFYRNVEKISVDNSTIAERFIIAKRLAPGSELNNIISQNSDEDVPHHSRVSAINTMVVNMLRNATSKGYPLDYGTKLLRSATGMYARVVLSSPHHIISQPITAFADYAMRTGNITGWLKAALYVATNHDKVHNWFMKNQRWTADRAIVEAMALDQRRSPEDDSQEYLKNHPAVKFLSKYYEGASNLLGFFIHNGDNFAVKATVLAEYERLMTQKYGRQFKSLDDLDMDIEEREILTEATMNSEKNINTSNKIFRGELFTDRRVSTTLIRNLLLPFAAHQSSLATQMNQAIRDLVELKSLGAPQSEKASKMRTIAAILMQQMTFTSMRFFLGSLSEKLIIGAIQDLFDDEEGKIAELEQNLLIAQRKGDPVKVAAAQHELENAKHVRKVVAQMQQTSQTPDSLFKQMIRDSIGSFHISFNNGSMQQVLTFIPDAWAEKSYRMGQEAVVKDLEAQIRKAKEREQDRLVGKLTEQKAMIESTQYIPLAYESVGGFGLGGLYGATLDNWKRVMVEGNQAVMGVNEWNWTDFMMDVAALGIGQAEFSKTMNAIDKIEDAQWKENAQYQNSKLPDAQRRKLKKSQGNLQLPSARLSELPQI